MAPIQFALGLESAQEILQDRARVIEAEGTLIVAVADGAGGIRHSERAAEAVVRAIDQLADRGICLRRMGTWTNFLAKLDESIGRAETWGQTTAIVLAATDRWICGASVGDSEAWLATEDRFFSLTAGQHRKPFLGSGAARPISFRRPISGGTLIVGTDGLFKYAPAWRICEVARGDPLDTVPRALIDLVRLPDGRPRDDVGVVVCRFPPTWDELVSRF